MNFNTLNLFLIVFKCVIIATKCETVNNSITYVDEIEILKKIFVNLNELKSGLERCNSRFEEYQKNFETPSVYNSTFFDIRYDTLPEKCKTSKLPKTCEEATFCTQRSGIYKILFEKYHSTEPFLVECDVNTDKGGWLLIQRRQDGSVDFYRNWSEYKKGFGNIDGEFFIGLDKLHALTNENGPQELLIVMEDNNEIKFAKYNNFVIGNESEQYKLKHLGAYEGNAGDSLLHHVGAKFSTKDRDNDESGDTSNCAVLYTGAWWYKKCHVSNLNGKFGDTTYAKGITWHSFRGYDASIRHVKMMIRRRRF